MTFPDSGASSHATIPRAVEIHVALLTGGSDKHYSFGLAMDLLSKGVTLDFIGSDELDCAEFRDKPGLKFFNLRGGQRSDANFVSKVSRILAYYFKLVRYAATAKPRVFHILWNNKFETLDRTLMMLYYRLLGKKVVFTAHNVNAGRRDSHDTLLNRVTLRAQYRLANHIFVHTHKMKRELIEEFGVRETRVTVIPYGINNAVPDTQLTPSEAKRRLGIRDFEKTMLFFGRITPYKGLEYLLDAFHQILTRDEHCRLIIAGRPEVRDFKTYWDKIREVIEEDVRAGTILLRSEFIPDDQTEVYFKAADVLVLPYRSIYQSGILFLGHSFGLPVLAADVGSLNEEIVEGQTGFIFKPEDPVDLARVIERYFASDLFAGLNGRRPEIREYATERHSWQVVGQMTRDVYASLLRVHSPLSMSNVRP